MHSDLSACSCSSVDGDGTDREGYRPLIEGFWAVSAWVHFCFVFWQMLMKSLSLGKLALESPFTSAEHLISCHSSQISSLSSPLQPPTLARVQAPCWQILRILVKCLLPREPSPDFAWRTPSLTSWVLDLFFPCPGSFDYTVLSLHLFHVSVSTGDKTHP